MNRRGAALIICYMVIVALSILAGAFLTRSISERSAAGKYFDSTQAFWLAEAGINQALYELRIGGYNVSGAENKWSGSLSPAGQYTVDLGDLDTDGRRHITAHGYVPSAASVVRVERVIEVTVSKRIPTGFYDNAIYAAGDLDRKGNVNGTVTYAGTATGSYKDPQPTSETYNPSISPLALLDFNQLRVLSKEQNNYHDADHLDGPFPTSFWYDTGVPNVVFLEGNFTLKGKESVAGFFVVGGETTIYNVDLEGTASVNGCIYTRGNFSVKGGGGVDFNVKGVWVGGTTILSGSSVITYDGNYMTAIQNLGINADVQVISWQETQNPY